MHNHISKVASTCFFHLRRLHQLRHVVILDVKQRLNALVLCFGLITATHRWLDYLPSTLHHCFLFLHWYCVSGWLLQLIAGWTTCRRPCTIASCFCTGIVFRVDYCNSSLAGLPAVDLAPLHLVSALVLCFRLITATHRWLDYLPSTLHHCNECSMRLRAMSLIFVYVIMWHQCSALCIGFQSINGQNTNLACWCTSLSMGLLPTTSAIRWHQRQLCECLAAHISQLPTVWCLIFRGHVREWATERSQSLVHRHQTSIRHSPID